MRHEATADPDADAIYISRIWSITSMHCCRRDRMLPQSADTPFVLMVVSTAKLRYHIFLVAFKRESAMLGPFEPANTKRLKRHHQHGEVHLMLSKMLLRYTPGSRPIGIVVPSDLTGLQKTRPGREDRVGLGHASKAGYSTTQS
jgi:hypothetical protein